MADNLKRRYNVTALQRGLRLLQLFGELARGPDREVGFRALTAAGKLGSSFPGEPRRRWLFESQRDGVYHLGIAGFAIVQAALVQLDVRRMSLCIFRS